MNKKKIIILSIICIFFLVIGAYVYFDHVHKQSILDSITLEFNDIKVIEYGQAITTKELIKSYSGTLNKDIKIDVTKVGKQTLVFELSKQGQSKEFTYEVEIKDTKAPEILLNKEEVTLEYKQEFDPLSLITSIKDPIDGDIVYKAKEEVKEGDIHYYTYESNVNTLQAGTYQIRYVAIDKHHNQSETTVTIIVKEEVQQPTVSLPQADFSVNKNRVIVIDPGHQGVGNNDQEAVGPGSSTMKAKVAGGATGVVSRKTESLINLEVGLKLKAELEARGYTIIMTRTSQNVNISNQQRAQIGNSHNASAIIHLHCDSANASSARGAHTIAIASNNPYCPSLYSASSLLANSVISNYCATTGIKSRGVSYRNDLTGLNWSTVPAIYLEMGFISNSEEDSLLSSSTFQTQCAIGIANGIDAYYQ